MATRGQTLSRIWPLFLPIGFGLIFLIVFGLNHFIGTPVCALRKYLGLHCPGCGGTRCAHALLQGDLKAAFWYNPIAFLGLLGFLLLFVYLTIRITILGKTPPRFPHANGRWIWAGIGILFLFTLFRNLPWAPFTYLAP